MAMNSIDPLAVTRPSLPTLSASASYKPVRRTRTQTSPKFAANRDVKLRKASPPPPRPFVTRATATAAKTTTTKWISKNLTRGPPAGSDQILPLSERRCRQDTRGMTPRPDTDPEAAQLASDGTSAGREGRQFAVSNVGNNGRIYLRPSVRPAQQRYPQPNFALPITPPSTAAMDSWSRSNKAKHVGTNTATSKTVEDGEADGSGFQTPPWTPTTSATPSAGHGRQLGSDMENPNHNTRRRRRAISDGTIPEASAIRDQDSRAFKIAISPAHDRDEHRPRTMDDLGALASTPMLNVNIPSWRLGTPRFTLRGTPMLRGSSYAPTEDVRSSCVSDLNSAVHGGDSSGPANHLTVPTPRTPFEEAQRGAPSMPSRRLLGPSRPAYMSIHEVIEPAMFTKLTFKPFCDDELIVRYSSAGAVTAATPPRLVAEITSPSFLDYELLSDFFLTFRSFLEPSDLLRMLVARLRWALDRDDEVGMIVRVRTFVALRHWILNYFMDDFIVEYGLRVTFCNLLNDFVDELSQDVGSRKVQLKILAELKKCWRRVCAQCWGGDEIGDSLGPEAAITPGGMAGSRDSHTDLATALESSSSREPDRRCAVRTAPSPSHQQGMHANFRRDIPNTIAVGDFVVLDNRPATPENQTRNPSNLDQIPMSPYSLASLDVVSCSFPGKNVKTLEQNTAHLMAAHPVPSNALGNANGAIATTPKSLVGKRVRPTQTHKRNDSLSGSIRERQSDQASCTDQDTLPAPSSGGRLVRGNLLPPGHAIVDVNISGRRCGAHRQTTVFQPKSRVYAKDGILGGAMSGHGMRKLLRSVRNALKNRGHGLNSNPQALDDIQPAGPRGATVNRLPGTAVVPQETIRQNGCRPPVRIDLLGAEVAEDFKKAVREEEEEAATAAAAAAAGAGDSDTQHLGDCFAQAASNPGPRLSTFAENAASPTDPATPEALTQHNDRSRPFSDMGIAVGSKSIVIVDDTVASEMPSIHRTHGIQDASADTFGDLFMPGGADPTPPNTPPSLHFEGGTPRRSSFLLDQHVILDLATLGASQRVPSSEVDGRPSTSATRRSEKHPFETRRQGGYRFPRRSRSLKSQQSFNALSYRRATSFGGVSVSPTLRDLDATTVFGKLDNGELSQATMPEPLRVLRRRPGGDLKAVQNIGDLDKSALRRSRSVGSLVTYTESIRSSYMLSTRTDSAFEFDAGSESGGRARVDVFSLGQLAERSKKRELSLFSTGSVQAAMRPSFEAEAQKLAQIPDDDDDGIESALLKLEGKYRAKRPIEPPTLDVAMEGQEPEARLSVRVLSSSPSEGSYDSYCSIPLLERDLDDEAIKPGSRLRTERSIFGRPDDEESTQYRIASTGAAHSPFDFVHQTASIEEMRVEGKLSPAVSGREDACFSKDHSANGSELVSGSSLHNGHVSDCGFLGHPNWDEPTATGFQPFSARITLSQALAMSPEEMAAPVEADAWPQEPLPPTPDLTPVMGCSGCGGKRRSTADMFRGAEPLSPAAQGNMATTPKLSVHLPFILAFDSAVLAQQFTLIEKDALTEIDWRELVDMNWKQFACNNARSWVEFLRNIEARGVDVVIARFNIMVKWAISEIVLTQHIEERARCIIKLIHIAAHCRRYRNFATLAQLTIALSSSEVSRLSKTWQLVPEADVKTLHDLEVLVTPSRNFYKMREEMETGTSGGCIPFVGIYTHDLLYNAQRPAEIAASSPTAPPLVNFQRCRIGAAVVKTLLRLLEASTRYTFQPIEGVTERCLWIGALSDDEIRKHSRGLE
ncbi:hypothetical protein E4U41_000061 [Claviceps citrina]|nr:hypothetical protein E4U41_000061 [Claviceps citrina]